MAGNKIYPHPLWYQVRFLPGTVRGVFVSRPLGGLRYRVKKSPGT